ncbi:MAG: GntR family transcriptional regulator, partial [Hymenobacteraceae bacterium]|nr:GntR family transcriptional regulator [Hymenobacteraceae bacterium]MDX5395184.1 GntR family transcriptional regulator [Hymenobacteraceae bacterium]MDX5511222.1 GntR family transcriptional regulator [Hymenobacteraceae bacterium]
NNRYLGILYKNEVFQQLRLGDKTTGYIKQIRPDNKIDVSLQKTGYSEVEDAAEKILSVLQQSKSNTIPLTDKSSSEEISQWLGMSKQTFKKAIGNLYKNQQVTLEPDQIRLKK